eukprot:4522857-Amphidinium_carterae.1
MMLLYRHPCYIVVLAFSHCKPEGTRPASAVSASAPSSAGSTSWHVIIVFLGVLQNSHGEGNCCCPPGPPTTAWPHPNY